MQGKEQLVTGDNSVEDQGWLSTKSEITALKVELEKVKLQMAELQKDYSDLQQDYDKLNHKQKGLTNWTFRWHKIRHSSLFHKKEEFEEPGDGPRRETPANYRVRSDRRQSVG